jgi:polysaccharide export outer membrane protein
MKHLSGHLLRIFLLFLISAAFLISCVSQKKVKYLQKQQKEDTTSYYRAHQGFTYKIQAHDVLYIRIYSIDDRTYQLFNRVGGTGITQAYSDADFYINGYTVNDSGYIRMPVMGKVYVRDLTVEQVQVLLQSLVDEYLKETTVVVKMVNFKITVVGEVKMPGEYSVYQDKINIFQALSMAGDLPDFANRNRVALIRQTHEGSTVHYLDLTSDRILTSEYYYLQPNDILYIPPLGIKRWGAETFPWAVVFAAISTALLLINYFK